MELTSDFVLVDVVLLPTKQAHVYLSWHQSWCPVFSFSQYRVSHVYEKASCSCWQLAMAIHQLLQPSFHCRELAGDEDCRCPNFGLLATMICLFFPDGFSSLLHLILGVQISYCVLSAHAAVAASIRMSAAESPVIVSPMASLIAQFPLLVRATISTVASCIEQRFCLQISPIYTKWCLVSCTSTLSTLLCLQAVHAPPLS